MAIGPVGAVMDCVNEVLLDRRIPIDPTKSLADNSFTVGLMPPFHFAVKTCLQKKQCTYTYPDDPTKPAMKLYMTKTLIQPLRELYTEIAGKTKAQPGALLEAEIARPGIAAPKAKAPGKARAKKAAKKAVKKAAKKAKKKKAAKRA